MCSDGEGMVAEGALACLQDIPTLQVPAFLHGRLRFLVLDGEGKDSYTVGLDSLFWMEKARPDATKVSVCLLVEADGLSRLG